MAVAAYYPVFLNLKGRLCVVIGGGEVAERKVKGLLECEARVRIISPEVTPWLRDVAGQGEVDWLPREYREGDLKGAFLAIASTDRQPVNEAVAAEAAREKVVLNVVDNTPLCTFIAPSVVTRGDVTVAISTGGASPALARKLRESLESGGRSGLRGTRRDPGLGSQRAEASRRDLQSRSMAGVYQRRSGGPGQGGPLP